MNHFIIFATLYYSFTGIAQLVVRQLADPKAEGLINCKWTKCGNSSVGRASASQAEGRGFESRFPLKQKKRL
jgi:hypothetical protein